MSNRDERGNYINDKGVKIKISEYKDGSGIKADFYDSNPTNSDHKSIHTHISNDGSYKTQDNVNGRNESSSGQCYLTTACMKHKLEKFNDNCYELMMLRWFRDNFVSQQDIEHYYKTAPIIVEAINRTVDSEEIYQYIYDNVVDVCVGAIEQGDYDFAYTRYKNSILALEEEFARPFLAKRLVYALKNKNV